MPHDLYLAFVLASAVLILIPGPNVTLLVANSLAYGARRALTTLAGTSAAIALQLAITVLGMTPLMLALAAWFEWLRWAGVLYLVWLGIQQWRAPPVALEDVDPAAVAGRALFWRGFLVSATNPKTLLFYAAFLPQFVDPRPARPAAADERDVPRARGDPRWWLRPARRPGPPAVPRGAPGAPAQPSDRLAADRRRPSALIHTEDTGIGARRSRMASAERVQVKSRGAWLCSAR
jgi:threonine/homoserine/homoserine lactone efflux protein